MSEYYRSRGIPGNKRPSYEEQYRLDELARLLCETCGTLETEGYIGLLSPGASAWWEEHKMLDAKREILANQAYHAYLHRVSLETLRLMGRGHAISEVEVREMMASGVEPEEAARIYLNQND